MTGEIVPMRDQIERMLRFAEAKSRELGSEPQLAFAHQVSTSGTESEWRVRRWEALGRDLVRLELEIADRTLSHAATRPRPE